MKLQYWFDANTKTLELANISTARLDCLVLLEDVLEQNRGWLLAHPEHKLDKNIITTLDEQISRRAKHEPLAYIRQKSEFYGREFIVNHHTLQPRPETETMIELLKKLVDSGQLTADSKKGSEAKNNKQQVASSKQYRTNDKERLHGSDAMQGDGEQRTEMYMKYIDGAAQPTTLQRAERTGSISCLAAEQDSSPMSIVDVGTGSGCIAITTKLLYPQAHVIATDIDNKCLGTAKQNAKKLGAKITFCHGNLLEPLNNTDAGFTYAEAEADFFLSSGVRRMSDTAHEQRKGKSGSDPQTNNRIAGSAGEQDVGGTWILLANLPYVPDSHTINPAAMHEPRHAIFGGADGLDYYRSLFEQSQSLDMKPRLIFTEAMPPQHDALENIARLHSYQLAKAQDFIQVFSPIKTATDKNT